MKKTNTALSLLGREPKYGAKNIKNTSCLCGIGWVRLGGTLDGWGTFGGKLLSMLRRYVFWAVLGDYLLRWRWYLGTIAIVVVL